ncbi:MAG: Ferredoxin [uncultured Sulfurovum sp.]|uniref:Ferredoxin n=1 Tax=uncultured Sulfurovum sp. TaxID=269237 RepID=A0A6S6T3J1_9BACT|nr:MAG: Ferredoxin [uncultured Sulfurovum sp.]
MMSIPQPAFYMYKCQQSAPPGMPKPSCVTEQNPESKELMQHLSMTLMQKGIIGAVQAIQTGCLGRCLQGPVMMVEPGHVMYVQLTKEKITRIIEEHIIGGNVVEEYVIPEQMWGDPVDVASLAK